MQERFEISDREEFLEPRDFGRKISQDLVNMINGHPIGDAERDFDREVDNEIFNIIKRPKKRDNIPLFEGLRLNQLTIVKADVYVIGEKTNEGNFRAGYLKNNAVITHYIDPEKKVWTQTKDGRWPYKLLTPTGYYFNSRKMAQTMNLHFNPGEIVSLPDKFDRVVLEGEQKRREIEKIKAGIRK